MKSAASCIALATFLHSKSQLPLRSAFLGRDYSGMHVEKQQQISSTKTKTPHVAVSKDNNKKTLDTASTFVVGIGGICLNPLNSTLLVCDVQHSCVRVLDVSTLQLQHTIGGKGGNPGKFLEPHCIAINITGTIAISDAKVNRIQIFSMQNTLLAHFGRFGSERGQFNQIMGLAFTHDGHLVVADCGNHRLVFLTTSGSVISIVGTQGDKPREFQSPVALALNVKGDIFVCDRDNHRIQVLNARTHTFQTVWGCSRTMNSPSNIAIGPDDGDVFVSDASRVVIFTQCGIVSQVLPLPDVHGICFHRYQLLCAQAPNRLLLWSPYRNIPAGQSMIHLSVAVFDIVLSFLNYEDVISLRQTNKFYHRTCKQLRDAWQLYPLIPGVPCTIRYGKVSEQSTGLVAVHDLYSKWGEFVHAKETLNDSNGLQFESTFNCAICEYFGPKYWFQHEESLRIVFQYHAIDGKLYRNGFIELVTVLREIEANFLHWNQCLAFATTHLEPPLKRHGKSNRLELLEETQGYQLDKLMLKLKSMV